MKRMFDFVCVDGHKFEKLVGYETSSLNCDCGKSANRVISAPAIKLEGWSGHFPGEAMKFERKHREKLIAEQKANS